MNSNNGTATDWSKVEETVFDYKLTEERPIQFLRTYTDERTKAQCPSIDDPAKVSAALRKIGVIVAAPERINGRGNDATPIGYLYRNAGFELRLQSYEAPGSNGHGVRGVTGSLHFIGSHRKNGMVSDAYNTLDRLFNPN